jgi:hypothetical protein
MFARPIWFFKKIIYKNLDKKLTHQVLYLKKKCKTCYLFNNEMSFYAAVFDVLSLMSTFGDDMVS